MGWVTGDFLVGQVLLLRLGVLHMTLEVMGSTATVTDTVRISTSHYINTRWLSACLACMEVGHITRTDISPQPTMHL